MAFIKYTDAADIAVSLKRSIECGQYSTEMQLVWLVELIVVSEFIGNPVISPDYKNKYTCCTVSTNMIPVSARYSFLWEKFVKFRNSFCHDGVLFAIHSLKFFKDHEILIIELSKEYGVTLDLNNYIM